MNLRELRSIVLVRDGECVEHKRNPRHTCHDVWGEIHGPHAVDKLTLEHVKADLRMGVKAPDVPERVIAVCWQVNAQPPSKEQRAWYREYLSKL